MLQHFTQRTGNLSRAIPIYRTNHLNVSSFCLRFFTSKPIAKKMVYRTSTSLLLVALAPQRSAFTRPKHFSRRFSDLALSRKPYPLLSTTPCELAYIKPCKCSQLQQYIHFNPQDPNNGRVKGTLDAKYPDAMELQADDLYVGEVEVSSDGLIHPESAC